MPRDPIRLEKNKQILKQNKDKNFVKRINNPALKLEDTSGGPSMTHFMESSDNIVYPRVVEVNGKLQLLSSDNAYNHAINTGEYIQFGNEKDAIDYGQNYKVGTPLEEFQNGGKMKKLKKIKKKYYPNGGNLAGDLDTSGQMNTNLNKRHMYLDSFGRGLAGFAKNLPIVGGMVNSTLDNWGVNDQVTNSKEGQTGAMMGSVVSSLPAMVSSATSFMGNKNGEVENPSSFTEGDTTGTGAIGGGSALDALNNPYMNAYGGSIYADGGGLNFSSGANYKKWLGYVHATGLAERTPGSQKVSIKGKPHKVQHAHGGSVLPHTMKHITNASHLLPHHLQKQNIVVPKLETNFAASRAYGGWVPPATDEQGGTTVGGVYYDPQDLALLTQFEGSNTIDPNTGQPFRVFTNQVEGVENTYSKKKKFKAMGGPMLTELNGGFVHEDPNPMNVNQGLPVGQEAVAEVDETKFSSNNPDIGEFIFSEREKDPITKKSYAKMSKIVKNKFKVRPDDVMAKEAMDQELNKLAMAQETQKAEKAAKLINKAMELSPEMFMAFGGTLPSARQALAPKRKPQQLPMEDISDIINDPYGDIKKRTVYPVNNKKKFPEGGKIDPVQKLNQSGVSQMDQQGNITGYSMVPTTTLRPVNTFTGNPMITDAERNLPIKGDFPGYDKELQKINFDPLYKQLDQQKAFKNPLLKKGGKLYPLGSPIDNLFVGPQLQNQTTRPYSLFNMPVEDQYSTPDIMGAGVNLTGVSGFDPITNNTTNQNPIIPKTTTLGSGPVTPESQEQLDARVLSSTNMPQDLSGINAGMFGLQAIGEAARLGMTPNSKLVGNINFDRVNPYSSIVARKKAGQEGIASMREGLKNYLSPSQYLGNMTGAIGDTSQATGMDTAALDLQGKSTNAQIQMREAAMNKQLEAQRNEIIAQDISNRSNQLGAVGAGLAQNLNTSLKDKGARDMDMYSLQFMNKDNYKMATTKEEAEKYGVEVGDYFFLPTGFKSKTSKIKKKYNT